MDLKDAVDLYREVLRRYSEGFSLEEVLGSVAEALGGNQAVLFVRKNMSSFLEPRLAWGMEQIDKERVKDKLLPLEWVARQPTRRYNVVEMDKLPKLGLEDFGEMASDIALLFPVRSHSHLRAALLVAVPREAPIPDQQSFRVAAISAILERMMELFSFEEKIERAGDEEKEDSAPVTLGILSDYVISKADYARAASLSLDLLIKLLNMDGGTLHRVRGAIGEQQAILISSRGWGGMPEIIEHLFENKLIDLLQSKRRSEEREFCLDAGKISEYFPGVKPYFHANQVKSFLLTPIFRDDRLVGLLTLFGKAYTALEPRDMELLVQLSHRLGALFSGEGDKVVQGIESRWDFPNIAEDLARLSEGADSVDGFLSSALRLISIEIGASMAFVYFGSDFSQDESFLWYASSVYGGESVFGPTPALSRMSSKLQRMSIVKPEHPIMEEMPAADQAVTDKLVLLLVPARERGMFLIIGLYLPAERRLTKSEIDSLHPIATMFLSLARGLQEKSQAESYRRSLEILTEIEGDLTACEDPAHFLRILSRGGRELLECDRAGIVVIDEEEGSFEGAVETRDGLEMGDLSLVAGREIALSLERGHALYSMEPGEEIEGTGGDRSFIAVPLIGRKGRLGALIFEKADQPNFFGEFQRRMAHFLAGQAVSVLESYKEEAKLESAAEETKALLRLSRRLSSSLTLEELGGGLYKELNHIMGAELLLFSIDGKEDSRRFAWWKGERVDAQAFDELLEPHGPLVLALSRAGKLVRNNLNTVLRSPGEDELALKGIRSYMAMALHGEETKGMLLVGSLHGGAFTENETDIIEKATGLINSALAVSLRSEGMQARVGMLEEMCRDQEEKYQTATDLINMASHEIRHPLTLIMGFSEVMRDYSDTLDAIESREVMDKLGKAADRLRRSVVNMMEVSHLESGKLAVKMEQVDLLKLLNGLVDELQARALENEVEVEVEKEAESIFADRDKLEIILFNLMDNAVKYSPPGSKVEVFARRTGREILVGVKDRGQGISEENMASIFQPFRQGEGVEYSSIKGMGLGLYIVNKLVEAHGGRIDVRSEHGRGSTFIAHIPQHESGGEERSTRPDALQA
jgi:signal transduction histidine kinase